MNYLAYGTLIESDIDLSGNLSEGRDARHQISLKAVGEQGAFGELGFTTSVLSIHGREAFARTDRPLEKLGKGQAWTLEVREVVSFHWRLGGSSVRYELGDEGNADLLGFWLTHIFLPFYLTMERHFVFLHASSVNMEGQAVLFIGPTKAGKSTTAGYFLRQGHALLSDDKLATYEENGGFRAMPSHGNYRPYRSFEDLGIKANHFSTEPLPIQAIYLLDRSEAESEVCVSQVQGFRTLDLLMSSHLYSFRIGAEEQLKYLARLINSVPMFTVGIPDDLQRLGEVYRVICAHSHRLQKQ